MLQELKTLVNRNEDVEEEVLIQAAYQLLHRQFLHRNKPRQRKHYEIISRFQPYFINLAEATGYELVVDETQGYAGIIPSDYVWRMKLDETLFLLVLRQLYDEEINAFHANDDGSVIVALEDVEVRYRQLTQREVPQTKSELDQLTAPLVRKGIIDVKNDEDRPKELYISILPSIAAVINSKAVDMIRIYLRADEVPIDTEETPEVDES